MSELQELIQKLCPDGVEYKKLEDIGDFFGGLTGKSKEDFKDGNSKFITYRNVYANPSLNIDFEDKVKISDNEKQHTVTYGDILFTGSSETPDECGMSSVVTTQTSEKLYLNSFCFGLRLYKMEEFNLHYLKHILRSNDIREQIKKTASGVTRYNVSKKRFAKIYIPVPPIEVQTEIAHILDDFTDLAAELQAELQARQEQYEYYRDKLLSFNNINRGGCARVTWMKMSEILYSIRTGLNPRQFFKLNTPDAHSYYVTIREFNGGRLVFSDSTDRINESARMLCNNRSNLEINDVLFSGTGTIGETFVIDSTPLNWNIKEGVYALKPKLHIIYPKYLKYILSQSEIKSDYIKLAEGGTVKSISMKKLNVFSIPVPTLSEQERIINILDKFEALTSDLSQGLPAEIAAVQEQYEYYRDKLLSFPKYKLSA